MASVGDIELFYELSGNGLPLVLIPGLGTDSRLFRPIIAGLGEYRTLSFDPRGAGPSSKPDVPYSIAMLADDTAALMQAVDTPSAYILGVSMGGRIALELALAHPAMVTGLILVSTGARTLPYRRPSWRWFVMDVAPRLPGVARLGGQICARTARRLLAGTWAGSASGGSRVRASQRPCQGRLARPRNAPNSKGRPVPVGRAGSGSVGPVRGRDAVGVTGGPLDQLDSVAVGVDDPRRQKAGRAIR
jgi:3-oxoadipate enol-lactonase